MNKETGFLHDGIVPHRYLRPYFQADQVLLEKFHESDPIVGME
jgi:hypothetical protein